MTCGTSAGPLRDIGPARKCWKNGGLVAPSGHSGILRRSLVGDEGARTRNQVISFRGRRFGRSPECPDRRVHTAFFQGFLAGPMSRRGPAAGPASPDGGRNQTYESGFRAGEADPARRGELVQPEQRLCNLWNTIFRIACGGVGTSRRQEVRTSRPESAPLRPFPGQVASGVTPRPPISAQMAGN